MPWNSLKDRITSLPLVIAGPILRRVDDKSVTVWIAVRETRNIRLVILDLDLNAVVEAAAEPIGLGENLFVLSITANSSTSILQANQLYFYNLFFDGTPMISDGELTDGILTNSSYQLPLGITYADYTLPSFVLPSSNMNHLKLVHGSCRKPHGGEADALSHLDVILDDTTIPLKELPPQSGEDRIKLLNKRPQFLCLTGDQIYADDVADALLYTLMDASEHLIGWGPAFDTKQENLPSGISEKLFRPGNRQELVAPYPDETHPNYLSSSHAKSHLITLGEFYTMYLFAWSDCLWPDSLPTFETLFPETKIYRASVRSDFEYYTEKYTIYHKELEKLKNFKSTLAKVRRAMANIPVYMMFDDHEITDDWFITREWVRNTMVPGTLTRRIVQNGLTSFALFQAWGNTPAYFQKEDALEFLTNIKSLTESKGSDQSTWDQIGELLLPNLGVTNNNHQLKNKFYWHFKLDFPSFRLIFLDTRTSRIFDNVNNPGSDSGSGLIAPDMMQDQLCLDTHLASNSLEPEVVIIVSPAPVIGNLIVESLQVGKAKLSLSGSGAYANDLEAWGFREDVFQDFLSLLSSYSRVLLLSGDVHYAFSLSLRYWNGINHISEKKKEKSAIGQLCSSSLKNSDWAILTLNLNQ